MSATYALIPAAGRGARFSAADTRPNTGYMGGRSKVYAPLCGRPLLRWTAEAFAAHPQIDGILVVAGDSETADCRAALSGVGKIAGIVPGGASRQESVLHGLYALGGDPASLILVHDGARPLVTTEIIDRCIAGAIARGNAVAAVPIADTLKAADAQQTVTRTVDRAGLWATQTPQAFSWDTLKRAHVAARAAGFSGTDEASLIEFGGGAVHLVLGSPENIKITRPEDLLVAEAILRGRQGDTPGETRVGFGYDIHRFAPNRKLILGGVEIADSQGRGLDGHSDADVLLHAICDALLGAAGLPDIGTLYPNTDHNFAGISSIKLLADVSARLAGINYKIVNVDATMIAESPKIAPYVGQMRAAIAETLGIDPARIGIKATTNEGIGALGGGAGIAAHAVASICS